MKECILKQYFGSITSDAPKLGELKLGTLAAESIIQMQFGGYEGFSVEIKGVGVSIEDRTNPFAPGPSSGANARFITTTSEGEIVLNDKYEAYSIIPLYNSNVFTPAYQLLDFQFCVKLHYLRLHLAGGLVGNVTELLLAMLQNGRVDGDMYVQFNGTMSYYNGTTNVTPESNTIIRVVFKSNGYTIYAASSISDTSGELIYDYTES